MYKRIAKGLVPIVASAIMAVSPVVGGIAHGYAKSKYKDTGPKLNSQEKNYLRWKEKGNSAVAYDVVGIPIHEGANKDTLKLVFMDYGKQNLYMFIRGKPFKGYSSLHLSKEQILKYENQISQGLANEIRSHSRQSSDKIKKFKRYTDRLGLFGGKKLLEKNISLKKDIEDQELFTLNGTTKDKYTSPIIAEHKELEKGKVPNIEGGLVAKPSESAEDRHGGKETTIDNDVARVMRGSKPEYETKPAERKRETPEPKPEPKKLDLEALCKDIPKTIRDKWKMMNPDFTMEDIERINRVYKRCEEVNLSKESIILPLLNGDEEEAYFKLELIEY